jgi:hypothetical protein
MVGDQARRKICHNRSVTRTAEIRALPNRNTHKFWAFCLNFETGRTRQSSPRIAHGKDDRGGLYRMTIESLSWIFMAKRHIHPTVEWIFQKVAMNMWAEKTQKIDEDSDLRDKVYNVKWRKLAEEYTIIPLPSLGKRCRR